MEKYSFNFSPYSFYIKFFRYGVSDILYEINLKRFLESHSLRIVQYS